MVWVELSTQLGSQQVLTMQEYKLTSSSPPRYSSGVASMVEVVLIALLVRMGIDLCCSAYSSFSSFISFQGVNVKGELCVHVCIAITHLYILGSRSNQRQRRHL